MMTALIKPPDSNSDSDDSDTSAYCKSNTNSTLKHSNGTNYTTNIKSKSLSLKSNDVMQAHSPNSQNYFSFSLPFCFILPQNAP